MIWTESSPGLSPWAIDAELAMPGPLCWSLLTEGKGPTRQACVVMPFRMRMTHAIRVIGLYLADLLDQQLRTGSGEHIEVLWPGVQVHLVDGIRLFGGNDRSLRQFRQDVLWLVSRDIDDGRGGSRPGDGRSPL